MATSLQSLREIRPGDIETLSPQQDAPKAHHRWSEPERDALLLALAADRPLLVRGEPGTGKTQLARAAAARLGWMLHSVVIHPRYEPTDLLYEFDAVRRLSDAQLQREDALKDDIHYWRPGPVWRALNWADAHTLPSMTGADGPSATAPAGHVLLIDEIDKADSDLPNSLLEVLGQRGFRIPALGNRWVGPDGGALPLVVITTNEERELPAAFLRRCIVLNLEAEADYRPWLIDRGLAHHGDHAPAGRRLDLQVLQQAADRLVDDRAAIELAGLQPPGPAEYLDLLGALLELAPGDTAEQLRLLDRLARYAYRKHGRVEGHPQIAQQHDAAGPAPTAGVVGG